MKAPSTSLPRNSEIKGAFFSQTHVYVLVNTCVRMLVKVKTLTSDEQKSTKKIPDKENYRVF